MPTANFIQPTAAMHPTKDKFTLYFLDESRGLRVMWMLEILGVDYEIDIHLRHPETLRGPSELFQVHPLGKAPVLDIKFAENSPDVRMAKSGLIMQYLLKHYDPNNIVNPQSEQNRHILW